jgi:hypothetical protein
MVNVNFLYDTLWLVYKTFLNNYYSCRSAIIKEIRNWERETVIRKMKGGSFLALQSLVASIV